MPVRTLLVHPENVSRFSVSLAPQLLKRLDQIAAERKMPSRSAAIADMVNQHAVTHYGQDGRQIMAGTLTLVYDNSQQRLREKLFVIQRRFLKEVIASQHVFLENDHCLEVLLVQGPAATLRALHDTLRANRGIKTAELTLTAALLRRCISITLRTVEAATP